MIRMEGPSHIQMSFIRSDMQANASFMVLLGCHSTQDVLFILSFWQLLHTNMTRSVCLREIHFEVSSRFIHFEHFLRFSFRQLGPKLLGGSAGYQHYQHHYSRYIPVRPFSFTNSNETVMMPLRQLANLFLDFFKSKIIYYNPKKWYNCSADASPNG